VKDIVLHSEARAELNDAVAFYEERREGLGVDFLAEVERALLRIQRNPKEGAVYRDTEHRKFVLRRFPYILFYRELPDKIRISAVAHSKRRPGYWKSRSEGDE
jgi:toxin ParE1/3/4